MGSFEPKHHLNQRFRFSNLRDDDAISPPPKGRGQGEGSADHYDPGCQRTIFIRRNSAILQIAIGLTHQ